MSPASRFVRFAVLAMVIAGACAPVIFASDGAETTGSPVGGVPVAVAVLSIAPASTSACCTTYVAVHSSSPPGARVRSAGHDTSDRVPAPENAPSTTAASVNVTLPVFAIVKVYVIF